MSDSAGTAATGSTATPAGADDEATRAVPDNGQAEFAERLYVPWWCWPLPLVAAVLLAAEVHMGYPGVRAWLPYVITIPFTLLMLVRLGRARIAVHGGELHAGPAHLPLRHVGEVEELAATAKRKALGPELDPAAFVEHRGWVPSALRVQLTDPDDPTPYWVISTRHPARLATLLRAGSGQRPDADPDADAPKPA